MFTVIYHFQLKSGREMEFSKCWHEATQLIRSERESLGSRLHEASDGSFVAYAQWPSREAWKNSSPLSEKLTQTLSQMRDCCENLEVAFELEVIDDLLAH